MKRVRDFRSVSALFTMTLVVSSKQNNNPVLRLNMWPVEFTKVEKC